MAEAANETKASNKGGLVALALLTVVAAGAGAAHGLQTFKILEAAGPASKPAPAAATQAPEPAPAPASAHGAPATDKAGAKAKLPSKLVTRDLQPLITNIVMPPDQWIRLEATIVYDQAEVENPEVMMAEVSGDLLGFLRTLTLREVQGADGLMFLRQDLKERVALRTKDKVRDFVIRTLVVQ